MRYALTSFGRPETRDGRGRRGRWSEAVDTAVVAMVTAVAAAAIRVFGVRNGHH